ncbi:uncharacterized protein PV09_07052 [Verruconis gallopava]|uniref:Hydrophobin n=1 Tax=Verruconis gallopava TaxID=253628 RepID=A0A0D2A460_9PEZI|nr:uncharacterized protein PV09_07052 [Verruconis gallopava]KIW01578.1 hypothetical protein PV09_07052 [Verruconis gallopava]
MQFKIFAVATALVAAVSAAPATIEAREAYGSVTPTPPPPPPSATCDDAYDKCIGAGIGAYVAWFNANEQSYGCYSGDDLKSHGSESVISVTHGAAFCCSNNPWLVFGFDFDLFGIVDIEKKISLGKVCKPIFW